MADENSVLFDLEDEPYDVIEATKLKPMPEDVSRAVDTMAKGLELFGQPVNWPPHEAPEDVPGHEDVEEPFKGPSLR